MKNLSEVARELLGYAGVQHMANNQTVTTFANGRLFQSYNSVIAIKMDNGKTYLTNHWDYSNTTGKYRNQFLGETKKDTQAKIDSGEYELVNGTKLL